MYQLVMLAKISSQQYAYCFSTENRQEYSDFSQRMAKEIPSELFSYFSQPIFSTARLKPSKIFKKWILISAMSDKSWTTMIS